MNVSRVDVTRPLRLGGCVILILPMILSNDMFIRRLLLLDHFTTRFPGDMFGLINKVEIFLSWRTVSRTVNPVFTASSTFWLLFVALQDISQPLSS